MKVMDPWPCSPISCWLTYKIISLETPLVQDARAINVDVNIPSCELSQSGNQKHEVHGCPPYVWQDPSVPTHSQFCEDLDIICSILTTISVFSHPLHPIRLSSRPMRSPMMLIKPAEVRSAPSPLRLTKQSATRPAEKAERRQGWTGRKAAKTGSGHDNACGKCNLAPLPRTAWPRLRRRGMMR